MTPNQPLLEMRGISKTFNATRALNNVSITVSAGETHALMGENGAGKSTLMKILSGAYTPDSGGEILLAGKRLATGDPVASRSSGVAVIYQELSLAQNLTVAQNIFLGIEPRRFGMTDRRSILQKSKPILQKLGATFAPTDQVSCLSLGERQMVEIARALAVDARIIVMDEPTTSLTSRETDKLFEIIAAIKAQGIAVIYISHRMEEIYRLADRVSVLRDGNYVGTLDRSELSADRLISMMVGRDLTSFYKKAHGGSRRGKLMLRALNVDDGVRVLDCSFDAFAGEVLGIAGLVGSGRTELARLIFGADSKLSGTIEIDGKPVAIASPRDALDAGIAYLTEDRKGLGLFLDMSIDQNINIAVIAKDAQRGGLLNFAKAKERSDEAVSRLSIRTKSASVNVGSLSGGNQQKALIARILAGKPKVVILDEPTRGVDVGAKSEIYRIIDELAASGIAVVVISSDLPEIIGISDRVLVMQEGRIAGEVCPAPTGGISQEAIMALSTGASVAA
ncbi:sugar ABC transporter ATP-binding protein [Agrobacterium genomosp. 3]|uniref:sugar ABC transporter ATP-binding protein n=1 Tax=Agrobacterium tomkonis TaxID=1183410 RepID=UPI001CD84198|nr:sugar ABC transporter ATP-binding protein [Agrobacterium tomkonis]MCA1874703.1 sugar ABC transporter ATP-binding protein [Agrobacterium tumefaciens]MCA1890618.1 sugar ABC transporter ATP-binding protein [Agrobacterium tomkonis]